MVGLCPQGTAIDNVDVHIYPLLGVTQNTQFFFNLTIKHPMCMGINVPQNICSRKIFTLPTKTYPWNMSLFNKNHDVIVQVDPHKQPLDAAS